MSQKKRDFSKLVFLMQVSYEQYFWHSYLTSLGKSHVKVERSGWLACEKPQTNQTKEMIIIHILMSYLTTRSNKKSL